MGSSKLEIFRVGLYVLFPVALFYYFNLPDNQDEFLEKRKKEMYPPFEETNRPPTTSEDRKQYREIILEARRKAAASHQCIVETSEFIGFIRGKVFKPFLLKNDKQVDVKKKPPVITRLPASSVTCLDYHFGEKPLGERGYIGKAFPDGVKVLDRVKDFIPLLASANENLEKEMTGKPAAEFDIENVEKDDQYVEMDLGLYAKDDDSSSSDSSDSSDSDEEIMCKMIDEITTDNLKLKKEEKTVKNLISEVEVTDNNHNNQNVKSRTAKTKKRPAVRGRKAKRGKTKRC
eukprot:Seg1680.14 transcript_id=Seg1680.14/GoldUCD/mRNA.D3Y31 product="putative protein C12orf45-like" protein_id=Seg1680.14/GoldUCD/D3Y31